MNPRLAIFLSGRGSTAQALFEIPQLQISLVVSNRGAAQGVLKAKRFGIPVYHFSKSCTWMDLNSELQLRGIDQIFMCGFMKIVPEEFVDLWQGRMWNIHPSLLPLFAGAHGIEDSLSAGGPFGVTIHQATVKMDEGPIWQQTRLESPKEVGKDLVPTNLKLIRSNKAPEILNSEKTNAREPFLESEVLKKTSQWSHSLANSLMSANSSESTVTAPLKPAVDAEALRLNIARVEQQMLRSWAWKRGGAKTL